MMRIPSPLILIPATLVALSCTPSGQPQEPPTAPAIIELDSPAGPGSCEGNLAVSGNQVLLSWLEKTPDDGHALRFSTWDGRTWSVPGTIVSGVPFFVNWADFPSVLPMEDGTLVAHWPQKSGEGTYAYDVVISLSTDGGSNWSDPVRPHRDGTPTEHGFVSLIDRGPGRFDAIWLDGRNSHTGESDVSDSGDDHGGGTADMILMLGRFDNGTFGSEVVLDPRVCDCCQTTAVATQDGLFVAYRDRSPEEVRDISFLVESKGGWSEPATLHEDGWEIAGCPVNGPAAAAEGDRVVVAWFTEAGETARVLAAFSADGGKTFGSPIQIDGGNPLGRVDVKWLPDGSALACWLESTGKSSAEVRARRVHPGGATEPPFLVARTSSLRSSGFPRMARVGGEVLFAWTDTNDPPRVRVARLSL
jgi:hypothetical protein